MTAQIKLEAWANGGAVWLARPSDDGDGWIRIDTVVEVDELIAALQEAKRQAFPERIVIAIDGQALAEAAASPEGQKIILKHVVKS